MQDMETGMNCNIPKFLDKQVWANTVDLGQTV